MGLHWHGGNCSNVACCTFSSVGDLQQLWIDFGWVPFHSFTVASTSILSSPRHCWLQVIFPVSRTIRINVMEPLISPWILISLQPVGDTIGLVNLFQYAVVSTTVVCIFWRTHYRIFTVADGKEAAANLRRREELARNMQGVVGQRRQNINGAQDVAAHDAILNALPMRRIVGVGAGDNNAANHPIYHGPW